MKHLYIAIGLIVLLGIIAALMNGHSSDKAAQDVREKLIGAEIVVPQYNNASVILEERESDGVSFFGADYTDPTDENARAFTSVDIDAAVLIGDADRVIIPFFVNYGGTGTFLYLGLFEDGETLTHLDSLLIEDRVVIESLEEKDEIVIARYFTRRSGEQMSSDPTVPAIVALTYADGTMQEQYRIVNAHEDDIMVREPAARATIEPTFTLSGEARGTWFFEASFPIVMITPGGDLVAQSFVEATDEWMTEDLVPFEAEISISEYRGPALLILQRDNPSDLAENNAAFLMPITIAGE